MQKARQLRVTSLEADGRPLARDAILVLARDYLRSGLAGHTSWSVYGSTAAFGPIPQDAQLTMTLADGRIVHGYGAMTEQRNRSFRYAGSGEVEGLTEADYP